MNNKKYVIVKLSTVPPSKGVREWFRSIIPKGVKILYKQTPG